MNQSPTRCAVKTSMLSLLTFLLSFGAGSLQRANAQCTGPSGTISVGPTGTYTTLTSAIAALSTASGISSSVILELQSTYTSSGETFPITFPANTCLTASRTITVRPASGATGLSITSSNTTATISFSGANYVTIDGRPGGTGTTSQLAISNTATGTASAIRFINDASNNTVTYCSITGSETSTAAGVVFFSTGATTGNDNNTISNNSISAAGTNFPLNGIFSLGSSTAVDNSGNTVSGNNISDYFNAGSATNGVNINSNNSGWTISNNKLFQTADRLYTTANTHNGINITSGAGYTISGNTVGFANASGTGTTNLIGNTVTMTGFPGSYVVAGTANATRYIAINCTFTAGAAVSSIQGNTIGGFALYTSSNAASTTGIFCGIAVNAGTVNIGTVAGNTIGAASGTGSIYTATSTTGGIITGIYVSSSNAVAIRNNIIGALDAMGNSSTISGGINGINIAGTSSSYDVSGNTIGNATNPNLRMGYLTDASGNLSNTGSVFGIASGTGQFNGILSSQVGFGTIGTAALPNTIRNASLNSNSTSASIRGITASGSPIISSNQINNLTSQTTNVAVGSTLLGGMGIFLNSISTIGAVVTKNNINTLSLTNTTTSGTNITAIAVYASSSEVSYNTIYNIINASTSTTAATPGTASGIFLRQPAGTQNIFNNMISLGNSQTTNTSFNGIWMQNSAVAYTMNCYYNSINIEGTASSGAQPSFCFNRGSYSTATVIIPVDIRNNVFVNTRTGGTGKHYAIANCYGATAVNTGWAPNASNFNVLNAASSTVGYWTNDVSFAGWKAASASDVNSVSGVTVPFTSTVTADLHLSFGTTATQLESGGTPITGITVDFDGNARPGPAGSTRGGACLPDIGADEFDAVPLDLLGPVITYTTLNNTSCISGGTRVVSPVTITDCGGVNITTGTKPRLYYKKSGDANTYAGNTSSDNGWKYVEASNAASPFSFTIDYTKLQSAVATTDVIQYFIVAQDLLTTPNVSINSGIFAATPSTVALTSAAFPITGLINSYTIIGAGLSGNVNIGATGAYTTLTDVGGLFSAINSVGATGNITATIIDASITEPGTIALNSVVNTGCTSGTFTLTIKPQAALSSTLSGNNASAIIKLNGADNVTIDGSNNGTNTQNLTIINNNTGAPAVVWVASTAAGDPATGNVVKNCIITGNAITTTLAGIASSGSALGGLAEAPNNNNTYQNNTISLAQYGLAIVGPTITESGAVIANNTVGTVANAIGFRGMFISNQTATQITGNTLQNILPVSSPAAAVLLAGTTDAVNISGNTITNINSSVSATGTTSIAAISVAAITQTNTVINGNKISGVQNSSGVSSGVRAISVLGSGTTVSNNMISDIYNYQDATAALYATSGIALDGPVTGIKVYHNSVNLFGSHPGITTTGGVATCLYVNTTTTGGIDVRNNIFSNSYDNSTSTGDKSYAIYSISPNTVYSSINNNDYYPSGSATPVLAFLGSDQTTMSAVQSAFGGNANSLNVAPVFVSNTDLHLSNAAGANWCLNSAGATPAAVTTDFDAQTRSTPPDVGADEFTPTDNSTATPATQTSCSGTAITTIALSGAAASFTWTRDNTASVTGIAASGTGSISGTLTNTTSAPVTVTFTVTPLNAGGCTFGSTFTTTVIVNPTPTVTSAPSSQTVCTGAAISGISNSGTVAGTTFNWTRDNTVSVTGIAASGAGNISGTLTNTTSAPVTVTFTITPSYTNAGTTCTGTPVTSTVIVNPTNTITLSSAAGTNAQTLCINTPVATITYATTGATGATFSGLPAGVIGAWAGNVATISGTPTASGTFNYTITLTGGCGAVTATGTMTVTPNNTINLSSAAGTNAQTVCINTAATAITYATTGATGATFSGLPAGMSGSWSGNVATISGTPTASGTFNYTITLTGGCGTVNAFGNITVTPNNTVSLNSAAGTNAQSVCFNTPITNITYATTTATGATVTGLPAGVSGSWSANVVTISGTPTTPGTYNYTVTLTGGCGTATATGTISVTSANTIALSSATGSNAQSLCINTPITNISYNTTGATGATVTGLPAGVSGSWSANVVTITGTPTASGSFNYTVTLSGGCSGTVTAIGTITVAPTNTVTLTSAAATSAQTICINTTLTNITYGTTGATGATFTGLPAGVSGSWAGNVATISGAPTVSGTFPYTVQLTGGCSTVIASGTITVNPNNSITLTSGAGSNVQTLCINTPVSNVTYNTVGATGATFSGLPAGVNGVWSANTVTISGTPTASGTFSYTVTLTGGSCGGVITATGTITVSPNNTIALTSATGTNAQSLCINTAMANITYGITGATGATIAGLPAGVSGVRAGNVITISGTPTTSGTFNYTITLTGGCGAISATGTITVIPNNTITLSSGAGTNVQTRCINTAITAITYTTTTATGATITGLPAGVTGNWSGNVVTISGTPTAVGTYSYTVTLTGGCGTTTATGSITVNPNNTITLSSLPATTAQTRCVNSAIANITYTTTGATGATFSGLPAGVSGVWAGNTVTISGTPTASGTFGYTVTLTGGCATVTATGTITVNALPIISVSPTTAATICSGTGITLTASGATSYLWSPNIGLSSTTGSSVVANPTATITYVVTGTDANGCVNSATKLVTVNGLPTITITPTGPISFCQGLSATLNAFGAATYVWSPAAGLSSTTGSSVVASPSATTTYTVTGTAFNGCVNTATKTVTIIPAPNSTITPSGYVDICQDDTVYMTATPGYATYTWKLYGVAFKTGTNNAPTTTGGFYTLTVTDASGCSSTTAVPTVITVTQRPFPIITRTGATLDAGAGYSGYQWYWGGAAIAGATGRTYTPTSGGAYTVAVTDTTALHCSGRSEAFVYVPLGVNGYSVADAIRIYPNPASDAVHIDAPVPVNVTVSSIDGKQIFSGRDVSDISIRTYADGVYQVVISDKAGNYLKAAKITKVSH